VSEELDTEVEEELLLRELSHLHFSTAIPPHTLLQKRNSIAR
jgi:hypothetical protein